MGGLANSVQDGTTGFRAPIVAGPDGQTDIPATRRSIVRTYERALDLYARQPPAYLAMQRAGMAESHSWGHRMRQFDDLWRFVTEQGPAR